MAIYKRGGVWWFNFVYAGRRIQKPAKTTSKTVAKLAEKDYRGMLERVHAGMPAKKREDRVRSIGEIVREYLSDFDINHRPRTVQINRSALTHVTRLLGGMHCRISVNSRFANIYACGSMKGCVVALSISSWGHLAGRLDRSGRYCGPR